MKRAVDEGKFPVPDGFFDELDVGINLVNVLEECRRLRFFDIDPCDVDVTKPVL